MTGAAQHVDNLLIGSGEVYLDPLDADGGLTGERYLGDTAGAALEVATERVTVFSGDGAGARKLIDVARSVERTMTIVMQDISLDNLALFVGAAEPEASAAVAAAPIAAREKRVVRRGRWYQLGAGEADPAGAAAVLEAGFSVHKAARGGDAVAAADYVLDAASGRLFIKPGAAGIADGDAIYVQYTPAAAAKGERRIARTGGLRQTFAALRYVESAPPAAGRGRNYYARRCAVSAVGEAALKSRDETQKLTLACRILEPGGAAAALHIDGEPAG